MKVTIEPSVFNKALKAVQPSIHSSAIIPILENIKCTVSGDEIELSGTNTNLTICVKAKCKSKEDGVFLLPFKQVYSIVSLASLPIEITVEKDIQIKIGKEKFNFGVPSDVVNYPTLNEEEYKDTFPVNSDFISNLKSATKFTSIDKSGYDALSYVCIDLCGDKVALVSSDRNSLFLFEEPIATKEKLRVLPDTSFFNSLPLVEDGEFSVNERNIKFSNDQISIYGTLCEQRFVDYRFALREHKTNCIVPRSELLESLQKLLAIKVISSIIEVSFTKGAIKISFNEPEFDRKYENIISCQHGVSMDKIYLNAEILKKLIQEMPENETIQFTFTDEKTQVYLDDDKNTSFIVPVQILN